MFPEHGSWPIYTPQTIEPKWQRLWEQMGLHLAPETGDKPKYYCLDFFPYPSGEGLHVGHCRNYVPTDVLSRYQRMQGYNVLHPMGWDAFGEPAEQFAVLHGVHPRVTTDRNTANFRRQMAMIGTSYDWSREIDSSKPEFYRWTQWFFLLLYRRGLAYRDTNYQWWCPTCQTTLSSHEVANGVCWRGHPGVTRREIPAWYFKITAYADELLSGLDEIDWPESVKTMQRNWIGRSVGLTIEFPVLGISNQLPVTSEFRSFGTASSEARQDNSRITNHGSRITDHPVPSEQKSLITDHWSLVTVFTTRPDTIYGATFLALAPEHPLVKQITTPDKRARVEAYAAEAARQSEIERMSEARPKTGVFTGAYATNPLSGERVPVWVVDYVLPAYGTGAVMGVPAHDQRDFEFARKFGLPVRVVIVQPGSGLQVSGLVSGSKYESEIDQAYTQAYTGEGVMVNSGPFDGLPSPEAIERIGQAIEAQGLGSRTVQYRMRDWLISRQRYWGTPIPIVYCAACGEVPVPEEQLPVLLPHLEDFQPDGSGRSPLARVPQFVNTSCPQCGGPAARETDTMGGFACSSWYYLRFTSPHDHAQPFEPAAVRYWMPVDLYVGGAEHAVLHLLYARFWTKVMADAGLVPFREPFARLLNQGQLLGPDGLRMSKSRGNVITPEGIVETFGADALRVYELFVAPFEQDIQWTTEGINGARRFLNRVWTLYRETYFDRVEAKGEDPGLERLLHQTIRQVSERIETFRFNTMISVLMAFTNALAERQRLGTWRTKTYHQSLETLLLLLAPAAPHIAEELWELTGHSGSIHQQSWPTWNAELARDELVHIAVQVDGKVRQVLEVPEEAGEEQVRAQALAQPKIQQHLTGREIERMVYVPGRIFNIVTRKT